MWSCIVKAHFEPGRLKSGIWLNTLMISTPVVKGLMYKIVDLSLARNKTFSGTKFHVYLCYSYWVTWVQEEDEDKDKKGVDHGQK